MRARTLVLALGLLAMVAMTPGCGGDDGDDEAGDASVIPPATAISPTSAPPTTGPTQNAFPPAPENCDPDSASPAAAADDLELAVQTAAELVTSAITWNVTVTNTGDDEVHLVYPSGQDGDVALRRGGADVYRWSASQAFAQVIRCQTLGPGEQYRFELGGTSLVLEPGEYRLVATLAADPAPAPFRTTVTLVDAEGD